MQPLRYSINVTLDGCCDHMAGTPSVELHQHAAANIAAADALLFGRVTYDLMRSAWKLPLAPEMPAWMEPFARTIDAAKKYLVSRTVTEVDWNAELVRGDLATFVRELKAKPGRGIFTGGVAVPKTLAELGLIDEYEIIVHPHIVGRGPSLFTGLSKVVDLKLVGRQELGSSGLVALRYVPV